MVKVVKVISRKDFKLYHQTTEIYHSGSSGYLGSVYIANLIPKKFIPIDIKVVDKMNQNEIVTVYSSSMYKYYSYGLYIVIGKSLVSKDS